jgi:hypothetical protein
MANPETEEKYCPGGRIDVDTGRVMRVKVSKEDNACNQTGDCRFHDNFKGFRCSHYKPKKRR